MESVYKGKLGEKMQYKPKVIKGHFEDISNYKPIEGFDDLRQFSDISDELFRLLWVFQEEYHTYLKGKKDIKNLPNINDGSYVDALIKREKARVESVENNFGSYIGELLKGYQEKISELKSKQNSKEQGDIEIEQ